MSIVHDDGDKHEMPVDRMIEEFRNAQSRRLATPPTVKDDGQLVEWQRDAHGRMIEEFREAQSRRLVRATTVKVDD
jgi:YD repeat-containing protein